MREILAHAAPVLELSPNAPFPPPPPARPDHRPAHPTQRLLSQLVGERRALFILDGVEPLQYAPTSPTPGELKDQGLAALLKRLAATSLGLCVVTTRYAIADLRAYRQTTAPMHELPRRSTAAGVKLLRTIGVKTGSQAEFEKLVEDVDGHALTLQILGQFLVHAFHGDIRRRDRHQLRESGCEDSGRPYLPGDGGICDVDGGRQGGSASRGGALENSSALRPPGHGGLRGRPAESARRPLPDRAARGIESAGVETSPETRISRLLARKVSILHVSLRSNGFTFTLPKAMNTTDGLNVGYKYDVFISLAHDEIWLRWVHERFLPLFEHHLRDELGVSTVYPYVAKKAITGGMYWPDDLAKSHARSKTLLALLSRPYRNRPWCQIEFSMMRAREDRAKLRRETGNALIVPVFIHDGEDEEYKTILDGIQPIDLVRPKRLVSICMSPVGKDAKLLDDCIQQIAIDVARAIKIAPSYCDDWLKINCDEFLSLFRKHQGPDTQSDVPGRE